MAYSFLDVAEDVLKISAKPLTYQEDSIRPGENEAIANE